MALGLRYGPTKGGDLEGKERIYGRVRELVKRFEARHEHSHCRDLLGGEIRTPEGYARAKEQRVFLERCPNYVRDAAGFAEELL
jgi:hypothetical protein